MEETHVHSIDEASALRLQKPAAKPFFFFGDSDKQLSETYLTNTSEKCLFPLFSSFNLKELRPGVFLLASDRLNEDQLPLVAQL